ncbi:zinc ribbon domain-containing protein [bacterium]|nr:zinc ribbon domain-containing protein [bacterium]
MPLYEFQCDQCQHVFTKLSQMGEDGANLSCPKCGRASVRKIFSTFASTGVGMRQPGSSSEHSHNCASRGPFR